MGVRNCEELGINLQKICSRLLNNDRLVNLLYYTEIDPFSKPALTDQQKKQQIFNNLIRVVPNIGSREDNRSAIAIFVPEARKIGENEEFRIVTIAIDIYVPLTQWLIQDSNMRPFAIMGAIQESLNNKTINGLGKIKGGDFELVTLTKEMSGYRQYFKITEYD